MGRSLPYRWRVRDELWAKLEPLLPDPPRRFRHPGRCRYSARACLEGILYVLFTDTPWLEVPYRELGLPSGETCRRRLEEWSGRGLLAAALEVLQQELAGAALAAPVAGVEQVGEVAHAVRRLLAQGRVPRWISRMIASATSASSSVSTSPTMIGV